MKMTTFGLPQDYTSRPLPNCPETKLFGDSTEILYKTSSPGKKAQTHDYVTTDSSLDVRNAISRIRDEIQSLKTSSVFVERDHTKCVRGVNNMYEDLVSERHHLYYKPARRGFYGLLAGSGHSTLCKITDSHQSSCSRILWLLILLSCLGVLCYQLWDRLTLYASFPSHTRVVTNVVERLSFPAVTLCNLNSYRLSEVVKLGLYPVIHAVSQRAGKLELSQFLTKSAMFNSSYLEFVRNVSHQNKDFIQRCQWNGHPCGAENFTETYDLDHGLCYTFRPTLNAGVIQRPGPPSGLTLLLNVEQYEYVLGRSSSVGVKVVVHDPEVHPRLNADGLNAAVGSYTSMTIDKVIKQEISSGSCSVLDVRYEQRHRCFLEQDLELVRQKCGCEFEHAEHSDSGLNQCTVANYFNCITHLKGDVRGQTEGSCDCGSNCKWTSYSLSMSEASMSIYAAESWIRSLNDIENLERKFQKARDLYHKSDDIIYSHDKETLLYVTNGLTESAANISKLFSTVKDYDDKYNKSRKVLQDNLYSLNNIVKLYHKLFLQMNHVSYIEFIPHVQDLMADILSSKGTVLSSMRHRDFGVVASKLNYMKRQMDRLIFSESSGLWQITEGIKRFQKDLLDGYGQSYREFKSSLMDYQKLVDTIINTSTVISKDLLDEYYIITNCSKLLGGDLSRTNTDYISTKLRTYFSGMKTISNQGLHNLVTELENLKGVYEVDRDSILEMSNNLQMVFDQFKTQIHSADEVLLLTQNLATKVEHDLLALEKAFSDAAKMYLERGVRKASLANQLNNGELSNLMRSAKQDLGQLRETLNGVTENGRELVELVRPIASRISEFNLLSQNETDRMLDTMLSTGVGEWTEHLVGMVETQFALIADYQVELKDYARGSRINGKFYQNNFLQMEIYFPELAETMVIQEDSYGIFALASDIGASLSLYLGASLLTIFGLVDLLLRINTPSAKKL